MKMELNLQLGSCKEIHSSSTLICASIKLRMIVLIVLKKFCTTQMMTSGSQFQVIQLALLE